MCPDMPHLQVLIEGSKVMSFVITRGENDLKKQLLERSSQRRGKLVAETALAAVASAPAGINDLLPQIEVRRVNIGALKLPSRKLRRADAAHVERVAKSLKQLGQCAPVIISKTGDIIDGTVVVQAMQRLGLHEVHCVTIDHLGPQELDFLRIALNKLSDGSEWILDELKPTLLGLEEVGFDLEATGFTLPELDIIMQEDLEPAAAENEDLLEPPPNPVAIPGDLWLLGDHRLLCGDALQPASYQQVMGGARAAAIFTDPPWNIAIEGFVSGLGKHKHKDFKMAVGEMSPDQFSSFCDAFSQHCFEQLEDGGVCFICIDWRSIGTVTAAAVKAGFAHINTAIWNKGVGGMGSLYRSAHEMIPIFCKGKQARTNNVKLGKHGRDRTNVWTVPGANRAGSSANKALKDHPTPKPVELVEDAILDVTTRGEVVLDPFLGSGTTLIAAERSGRSACGIELDPAYVDVCIRRWEELTGKDAILAGSKRSFRSVADERGVEEAGERDC